MRYKAKALSLTLAVLFLVSCLISVSAETMQPNSWSELAPMHQARSYAGVASTNENLYVIGGSTRSGKSLSAMSGGDVGTNEVYNPQTDTWSYKSPIPTPMSSFAIATYNNRIYCFGPEITQVYDIDADTWTNKTPMPTARWSLQANVVDGKIYLIGGQKPDNYTTLTDVSLSLNEEYDPSTDTWASKAPMPFSTRGYASISYGGKIYIFGGLQLNDLEVETATQIYDPRNDSWSLGASSPFVTAYSQASVVIGREGLGQVYVFDTAMLGHSSDQIYFPQNDSWSTGISSPTKRMGFSIGTLDGLTYAFGGMNQTMIFSNDISIAQYSLNEVYYPFDKGLSNPTTSPTSEVPELSWLVIVPLLLSVFLVAVVLRRQKTALVKKH